MAKVSFNFNHKKFVGTLITEIKFEEGELNKEFVIKGMLVIKEGRTSVLVAVPFDFALLPKSTAAIRMSKQIELPEYEFQLSHDVDFTLYKEYLSRRAEQHVDEVDNLE
jgi:hypothetical protein